MLKYGSINDGYTHRRHRAFSRYHYHPPYSMEIPVMNHCPTCGSPPVWARDPDLPPLPRGIRAFGYTAPWAPSTSAIAVSQTGITAAQDYNIALDLDDNRLALFRQPNAAAQAHICIRDVFLQVVTTAGSVTALNVTVLYQDPTGQFHALGQFSAGTVTVRGTALDQPRLELVADGPLLDVKPANIGFLVLRIQTISGGGTVTIDGYVNVGILFEYEVG